VVVLTVVVTTGIDKYEEQNGLATAELPMRHRSKLSWLQVSASAVTAKVLATRKKDFIIVTSK
jgi:hypothetical protein